jgi:hypothetical protein
VGPGVVAALQVRNSFYWVGGGLARLCCSQQMLMSLLALQRRGGVCGYFTGVQFVERVGGGIARLCSSQRMHASLLVLQRRRAGSGGCFTGVLNKRSGAAEGERCLATIPCD